MYWPKIFRKKPDKKFSGVPAPHIINGAEILEWTRTRLPDPGAMNYSFDSELLPLQSPIDRAVAVRKPFHALQDGKQPYYPAPQVAIAGLPTVSGGIVQQPLYNPQYKNYSGIAPLQSNVPFPRRDILPAGRS